MVQPAETVEIVKEGALHPGDRGAVLEDKGDGRLKARFRAGTFTVDPGEYVVVERHVGATIEIVKSGALSEGDRGAIEDIQGDGDVEARFSQGKHTVKGGEYVVVS